MARLVRTRREGNQIFYELENDHVKWLIVDGIYNAEHAGSGVPAHHAQELGEPPFTSTIHDEPVHSRDRFMSARCDPAKAGT